ncbi:MAG TPA: hypothetical protein VIJ94_05575 [Caulobacteraceae bacterium]
MAAPKVKLPDDVQAVVDRAEACTAAEIYVAVLLPGGVLAEYHHWPQRPELPARIIEALGRGR